jgi:hypothetical protein
MRKFRLVKFTQIIERVALVAVDVYGENIREEQDFHDAVDLLEEEYNEGELTLIDLGRGTLESKYDVFED